MKNYAQLLEKPCLPKDVCSSQSFLLFPKSSTNAAVSTQVTGSVHRNQSACAVPENIIFAVAGFDAPQMNFVS